MSSANCCGLKEAKPLLPDYSCVARILIKGGIQNSSLPSKRHTFSASLPKASSLKIAVGHHRRIGNLNRKTCLTCCNQILSLSSNSWSPLRRWPWCFKLQLLGGEGRGTLSFLALAHMLDATQGTGGVGWETVMYVSVAHMWQELRLYIVLLCL